ncbi:dTDP-4-dehydrorhamnose 3,5-epimerase [Candidatus Woesebacteria bacterium RIFCSPHIGHO2_01_FULL_38_10]|uniref:dTDP-4-dehydrorhamnose 3,5-epimerase n=1 Tax=Candidatus Woesebacteria bacterium RIFCSPLOWO2_01_FULL_39_10b TaxID=1802517 RepID=A0A1F8BAG7_9BACT|nr:MAG: dTDP-4-dehydrorhamnose 3,5-epimerase [Candidatus Woesebacteria bacterium RIFCSPHIGHO2_01_FULL_38_10]OGM60679.1 MAG: dTDP-4-dehydrorhamnose 3,5-epimerase [Candidatus Woesebacteria bacterium RIFCSPLOWO2_01_FULL_39_10b]
MKKTGSLKFTRTSLEGVYVIEPVKRRDSRGFFGRTFCAREFRERGLPTSFVQMNMSKSRKKGTLRGLHYQKNPFAEDRLVRTTKGAVYDVVLDVRQESKTYGNYFAVELTDDNCKIVFIPKGCAHGFVTLENDTEILYCVTQFYEPGFEAGVRFDDPVFSINWPVKPKVVTKKDLSWPDFSLQKKL